MVTAEVVTHNNGRQWRHYPAKAAEHWIAGLDLGQSMDPSALSVLHHHRTPLDTWIIDEKRHVAKQRVDERFDIRHIERLPLGMPYPDQCAHVRQMLARPPLSEGCDLVVDQTGPGASVGDIFDGHGLSPVRVVIGSGFEPVKHAPRKYVVPKSLLVSGVDAKLHCGELRFAQDLLEADVLKDELANFQRHVTAAGRATFEARSGKHDDLVLSVAIALWWALHNRRRLEHCVSATVRGLI